LIGTISRLRRAFSAPARWRFAFQRQKNEGGLCIADFFRDVARNERDVIALQVVTMGRRASEATREWFTENRYQNYLYLRGVSVGMAEAFAEYLHKRTAREIFSVWTGEPDRIPASARLRPMAGTAGCVATDHRCTCSRPRGG